MFLRRAEAAAGTKEATRTVGSVPQPALTGRCLFSFRDRLREGARNEFEKVYEPFPPARPNFTLVRVARGWPDALAA